MSKPDWIDRDGNILVLNSDSVMCLSAAIHNLLVDNGGTFSTREFCILTAAEFILQQYSLYLKCDVPV